MPKLACIFAPPLAGALPATPLPGVFGGGGSLRATPPCRTNMPRQVASGPEAFLQLGFLLGRQACSQNLTTERRHRRQHLVGRDLAHQHAKRRLARRECARSFLHEVVIDADVSVPATERTSSCADRCTEQRI